MTSWRMPSVEPKPRSRRLSVVPRREEGVAAAAAARGSCAWRKACTMSSRPHERSFRRKRLPVGTSKDRCTVRGMMPFGKSMTREWV